MSAKRFTALVFDWGGVFQRTVDPSPRQALGRALGLPPGAIDQRVFGHPLWQGASQGQVGAETLWRAICAAVGWPEEQAAAFVARFFAGDQVDPELVRLTAKLRASGYRVGLLSNAPPPLESAGAAGRWGCPELFDAEVFSYQVGALKPDARLYAAAVAALGVTADQAVFVDDVPLNVEAAFAAGLLGIHFRATAELLEALEVLGMVPPGPRRSVG
jgi:putative hydrolase of the HAD superfamily